MIPIPIIPGIVLTNTVKPCYKVPTTDQKVKSVRLTSLRVCNTDSVARTFTLHIVEPGGSASVANTRFKDISVEPAGGIDSSAFFIVDDVLLPGYSIQASASAGSVMALSVSGEQYP